MTRAKRFVLQNRTAVITGAGGGIGRALALALSARGMHLAIADIDELGLLETARMLERASSVRVSTHVLDVADPQAVATLPRDVLAVHRSVDMLVNNAGVAIGGTFEQIEEHDFQWLFEINFWGVVRMTRAFLPLLKACADGALVNVSSIFGIIAPPGQTAYVSSKFAVRGFSMALRNELKSANVFVSVVHPGGVATSIAASAREPAGISAEERERNKKLWSRMLRMPPSDAAEIIVRGIERRKARILVGRDARLAALAERIAPVSYGRLLRALGGR